MTDKDSAPDRIYRYKWKGDWHYTDNIIPVVVGENPCISEYILKSSADADYNEALREGHNDGMQDSAKEIQTLRNRIKALEEYLAFIRADYDKITPLVVLHGYRWSKEDIEKGKELRKQLGEKEDDS